MCFLLFLMLFGFGFWYFLYKKNMGFVFQLLGILLNAGKIRFICIRRFEVLILKNRVWIFSIWVFEKYRKNHVYFARNLGFWFIAEFWIWDEISGIDFWLLIRLHNAGKTIVVKRYLTDEFEKKYEHIGFLGFLKSRTELNWTETGRFDSVSIRFRFFFQKNKISVWLFFIVKNRTEPKMITPTKI